MNAEGWYLYGVVEAGAPVAMDAEPAVEFVTEGRLAGMTSRVSLEEFDEAVGDLGPEQLVSACRRA